MVRIEKSLSEYPIGMIDKLGKFYDSEIANEYGVSKKVPQRLRKRLNIPNHRSTRIGEYICPICNKKFSRWKSQEKRKGRSGILFCSVDCQNIWQNKRLIVNCTNCNKEIERHMCNLNRHKHHFCNKKCEFEWKRKDNHPNYVGGYSSAYGRGWNRAREFILDRDKSCKLCGNENLLEVHHIIPYHLSKNNEHSNLITLCKSCHSKIGPIFYKDTDKYFGMINEMV